jgi:ribose transport system permease protein
VTAKKFIQDYGVWVALGALFLLCALLRPANFLTPEAFRNLINQSSYVGIVAIGMTLVIIAGGIDLSVGSIVALSGAAAVNALNATSPDSPLGILCAALAAVLVGLLAGSLNGALVGLGKLAPFIATLGGLVGYRSITLAWANGGEVRSQSASLYGNLGKEGIPTGLTVGGGSPLYINWSIVAWILVSLGAWFLLERTKFGRHMVAVGANEKAARYSGISVPTVQFLTYLILGACSGLAGVLLSMRFNSVASSTNGQFYELDAIAAVVIGGTSLSGGKGSIWATVAGVLLMGIIGVMMPALGISSYWQGALKGLIIVLAVLLQSTQGASGKA